MDKRVIDYLERRMRVSRDSEGRGDRRDYARDRRDYDRDERRGVRGTGPYGMGGRRYPDRNRRDYDYDERDYAREGRDYARDDYDRDYAYDSRDYDMRQDLRLNNSDMQQWKQKMRNADGTHGEHFTMQHIMHVAEKIGVKFDEYDEKEFCLVVNMMYSDYGQVLKKFVSPDKELILCAELAKAFLEDKDGPKPSEKLALYYHCIVADDEV